MTTTTTTTTTATANVRTVEGEGGGVVLFLKCSNPDCSYRAVQKYYRGRGPDPFAVELRQLKELHEITFEDHVCILTVKPDTNLEVLKAYTHIKKSERGGTHWYTGPLLERKKEEQRLEEMELESEEL
jgi:hypothetical protein